MPEFPIPKSPSIDSKGCLLGCRAFHHRRLPDAHVGRICAKPSAGRDHGSSVKATDGRPCHASRSRRLTLPSPAFGKRSCWLVARMKLQAHCQALRCWLQSSEMDAEA